MRIQPGAAQIDYALQLLQAATLLMGGLMAYLAFLYQPYVYRGSFMCDFIVRFSSTMPVAPLNGDTVDLVTCFPIFEYVLIAWTTLMTVLLLQVRDQRKTTIKRLAVAVGGIVVIQGAMMAISFPILWMLNTAPLALNAMIALCFIGVVRLSVQSTSQQSDEVQGVRKPHSMATHKTRPVNRNLRPSVQLILGIVSFSAIGLLLFAAAAISAIYVVWQLNNMPHLPADSNELSLGPTSVVICVSALIDSAGLAMACALLLRKSNRISRTVQWTGSARPLDRDIPANESLLRGSTKPSLSSEQMLRPATGVRTLPHGYLLRPTLQPPDAAHEAHRKAHSDG